VRPQFKNYLLEKHGKSRPAAIRHCLPAAIITSRAPINGIAKFMLKLF
jgi:hypothetical protein